MIRNLVQAALIGITCVLARAGVVPSDSREIYRLAGPSGNAIVVMQTRVADPAPLAGWWPQERIGQVDLVSCIQIQAVQKDKPTIIIGAYVLLALKNPGFDPDTGIEVLAGMLEPHRLWLVIREGNLLSVRLFWIDGGLVESDVLAGWESDATPGVRKMGKASAVIRRENDTVVIDVEDRQNPTGTTHSRFAGKHNRSGLHTVSEQAKHLFDLEYRHTEPKGPGNGSETNGAN